MLKDDQIIVYEPGNELSLEQFVEKYSKAYSKDNDKIPNICYKQTDVKKENQILASDIGDYDNFAEKMAWKIGCKKDNPQSYGRTIDLKTYYQNLNVNELIELCKKDDKKKVLDKIMARKVDRIGSVYAIATLFFISKGKYPIYDRFADVALDYLVSREGYPKKGDSIVYSSDKALGRYDDYIKRVECILRRLGKEGSNYIEYRDLDRALWVYGHGYGTNCNN